MCRLIAKLGKRITKARPIRRPWAINIVAEEEEPPFPGTASANVRL